MGGFFFCVSVVLIWFTCKVIEGIERLSSLNRSSDYRLAVHCGRNPFDVSKQVVAS